MTSVEVDENGMVHAFFDTGITRTIFQVPAGRSAQSQRHGRTGQAGLYAVARKRQLLPLECGRRTDR